MGKLGQFGAFELRRGAPDPPGASLTRDGVNFAVFARHATSLSLVLFEPGADSPLVEIPLHPRLNRSGDVWHALVVGPVERLHYGYRADREPNAEPHVHRFDPTVVLIDPYSRALASRVESENGHNHRSGARTRPKGGDDRRTNGDGLQRSWRSVISTPDYDWAADRPLNTHLADSVIYEAHVRGFTVHPSSGVSRPGTFGGLMAKIPYLKELGVTAVELMPIAEFDEFNNPKVNPFTGESLRDYWGYNPICFFAPKPTYGGDGEVGAEVTEFRSLVHALHDAGIEVILDIVLNHTGEGDERGRTISWRGLDNRIYYIVDRTTGRYHNYSGCGNTFNCNHPVVRTMLVDCLKVLGDRDARGRLPVRPGVDSGPRAGRRGALQSAAARADRRRAGAGRDKADRGGLGRRGVVPGGDLPELGPLGGVERTVPRRRQAFPAWRSGHGRSSGHTPGGERRSLPEGRTSAIPRHQLHHLPRRFHPRRPLLLRPEAQRSQRGGRATAASTSTSAGTAVWKVPPATNR